MPAVVLHASYSPPLVIASFLIAALASYTALGFAGRIAAARGVAQTGWLAGGALALGIGIWGMHFVGMLALDLHATDGADVTVAYHVGQVALSIVVAIAAAALALRVAARAEVGRGALAASALVMGLAIAGMHYIGMQAMRIPGAIDAGDPGIAYHPLLVGLAYAVAAVASLAALYLARRAYQTPGSFFSRLVGPAAVMGVAIAGMHYIGMASASFHPALPLDAMGTGDAIVTHMPGPAGTVLATSTLGVGVTLALFAVLVLTLVSTATERWEGALGAGSERRGTDVGSLAGSIADGPATPAGGTDGEGETPGTGGRRLLEPWRLRHAWRREADALDASGPSLRTKLAAGSGAAVLVLVVALVSYWGFTQYSDAVAWLRHTSAVRTAVQRLDTDVIQGEASGRGYLLTGRERYVAEYQRAQGQMRRDLTEVQRLTADNEIQQRQLAVLRPVVTRRFALLDSFLTIRRQGGRDSVNAAIARTDDAVGGMRGLALADSVHQFVARFDATEAQLYAQRSAQLGRRADVVTLVLLGGSVLAFGLILLIIQSIRRDVAAREAAQIRVREQAEALALQAEQLEQQQIELEQQVEEQQVLNEELSEVNQQLDGATRRRDRLIRQLERSNKDLDQFAYVASHDLKAPLRGISNLSSWIEEDLTAVMTDDAREQMRLLRGRVHRMEALIDGILLYSRAGRVRTAPEPIDMGALVHDAIELVAPPAGSVLTVAEAMPTVVAERVPLQQVFLNLIGNALKYGHRPEAPAVVRVGWAEEPTAPDAPHLYRFSVADNGPGIAPQYHERVFGIFQTLQSRDQVEGTGIGLSVVKKIVEAQGGRVWVESAEGQGATFCFTWPAVPAPTSMDS